MIKFVHTLFALPFALLATMLAARAYPLPGFPGWRPLLLILACMVTARSAAMAFNRLADRDIDAANPRTAGRELPTGRLSPAWVRLFTMVSATLFVICAFLLNPLAGGLSGPVLLVILAYSHSKRFFAGSHFMLGLSLAFAPIGAWVAVLGTLAGAPWFLATAVILWVAGFDIIYSCQDIDFDRKTGLRSLSARFGAGRALTLAALCHLGALATLVLFDLRHGFGLVFHAGLLLASLLLYWEHRIVRGGDLRRIDLAFFKINSAVGMVIFLAGALDIAISP
jgi:4-hydroxybenzoate polyprenyltransferase